ncbi:MarR family transcriptional regulator [Curtobacterium sp. 'Ferrero']|uniref:MarR family winged helix-turn-helix transcriptional regulator n=1 Tax=Curtobacterium sp. 'Ferrero' TaxID=2033654 RepID=UPI000BD24B48|nr:MarR family transcriptional regulator [Curtobacterium sp. 'Ferrero']PCN49693.1 MarR family transcriptional regulator [Curtobacterium sp. 'Ferrero']
MPATATRTSLATDLRIAVNRLSRTLRNQKADTSVTDAQFSALARLHRDGPMTLAELSRQDGVTPPSMTKTVAVLTDRGLVTKTLHDVDRRKVLIAPTPAGAAFVEETRRRRDGWLTPRLARLTPAERTTLAEATDILRRLAQQ